MNIELNTEQCQRIIKCLDLDTRNSGLASAGANLQIAAVIQSALNDSQEEE